MIIIDILMYLWYYYNMIEQFQIPRLRKTAAIVALSGAALAGCGESSPDIYSDKWPVTHVTMPESGPVDTMSELIEQYCASDPVETEPLTQREMHEAVYLVQTKSNKNTPHVQPGEVLTFPVAMCDVVRYDD